MPAHLKIPAHPTMPGRLTRPDHLTMPRRPTMLVHLTRPGRLHDNLTTAKWSLALYSLRGDILREQATKPATSLAGFLLFSEK